jgi:transcription-repair coupling factor (superfamily II helicase)
MQNITQIVTKLGEYTEILSQIEAGRSPVGVSGLSTVHRAQLAAALSAATERPLVFVCADEQEGRRVQGDLSAFTGSDVPLLAGREFVFHNATASREWEHQRLKLLRGLQTETIPVLVATVEGLLQRTMPPDTLHGSVLELKEGKSLPLEEVTRRLVRSGYTRCEQVEGPGQFAQRGGVLDVYSPAASAPVRCEFWGDEIDTMAHFDKETQRRTENIRETELLPAAETVLHLAPDGLIGLVEAIELQKMQVEKAAKSRKKRDVDFNTLLSNLEQDSRAIAEGVALPAADRYLGLIYPQFACGFDYLPWNSLLCWGDSSRCVESAAHYLWRLTEDISALSANGTLWGEGARFCAQLPELGPALAKDFPNVYLDPFTTSVHPADPRVLVNVSCKQLPGFGSSLETALSDLKHYRNRGFAVVVLFQSQGRAKAFSDLLEEEKVPARLDLDLKTLPQSGEAVLAVGGVSFGFEYPGFALIAEGGGAGGRRKRRSAAPKRKKEDNRQKLLSFTDLEPGDLVVHETYGIARYVEMTTMKVDGENQDFVKLAYAGGDHLYVPATRLDMVSKYIGGGEDADGNQKVKLSRLGGSEWGRAKTRAKTATRAMAKELIQLYAQRQRQPGHAFRPDDPWQTEFENSFEYQETDDQLRCVAEVKRDMEKAVPMDRLLCGDVGYGKTEVALRAVMKCVLEGKQAAILVPTTVLAAQHYQTATRRFEGYPIRVAVISRYQTGKKAKELLEDTREGRVDVLIGTHRLLSKGIEFKDLGLLVVDEEQRFGVGQKEKLKERFRQVDVLTLSATPIPRTLNMAMSGLRDMSVLEEPPQDRQPVQTYVLEHDWKVLTDAIRREIGRGGQVYYLHNRVEDIEKVAVQLRELLDDESVRLAVAHGKMTQEQISDVMGEMVEGEIDVLVCTTIIETGIDIPNVNTLIIDDADRMGLSQLHQIRGRVGRSSRRAFAYLTYRRGKVLTEIAAKRLSAVREFAEFGAGYKIAMRDLEIRGAGDLLGAQQSGNMMGVGYDLYLKLLEEAVLEERGEQPLRTEEVSATLSVAASIPAWFVPSAEQRMDLYRRIARVRTQQEGDDIIDELVDRYGDVPRETANLVQVALLRSAAARCDITEIRQKGTQITFFLREFLPRKFGRLAALPELEGRMLVLNTDRPNMVLRLRSGESSLKWAVRLVALYDAC